MRLPGKKFQGFGAIVGTLFCTTTPVLADSLASPALPKMAGQDDTLLWLVVLCVIGAMITLKYKK